MVYRTRINYTAEQQLNRQMATRLAVVRFLLQCLVKTGDTWAADVSQTLFPDLPGYRYL